MVLTVLQDKFEFSIFMSVNGMDRPCSTLKLQYWSSEHGKEHKLELKSESVQGQKQPESATVDFVRYWG